LFLVKDYEINGLIRSIGESEFMKGVITKPRGQRRLGKKNPGKTRRWRGEGGAVGKYFKEIGCKCED
jgi:hypothetical protein